MKNSFFAILIFLIVHHGCKNKGKEKYFTGTLKYSYTYISDSLNTDSLKKLRPAKGYFRYDTSNYQNRFTGADTFTYYYSGKLNKCLSESGSSKKYECEDYSIMTDSVLSVKDYATEEEIHGYSCRILELQKKNSWVKYYYATDMRIAPATYKNHKAYNWDVYGTKANGGLILKMEHRFKKFTMSGVADSLSIVKGDFKALEIDEALFSEICK
ncbi:MAG: hypothetical protein V9F01_10290 [Chitinophagaceae bacterium]